MADRNREIDPRIAEICVRHAASEGPLLPILHAVQASQGYVSDGAIQQIAAELNLSRADVFGVVSFYHDFHRTPPASHTLKVCRAEACQAVGGRAIWSTASEAAAKNDAIDVEAVYCLGNCACAPSVQMDGRTLGRMSPERVAGLFAGNAGVAT